MPIEPPGGAALPAAPARNPLVETPGTPASFVKPTEPPAVERPPATSFDVDIHYAKAADSYEAISREYYSDTRYAAALQAYNRNRPLQANTPIDVPPLHVVRKYLQSTAPQGNPGASANPRPDAEWGPASTPVRTVGDKTYRVPQGGMSLVSIAKDVLGNEQRWRELYDLNPQVTDPGLVPAGTEIKLPNAPRSP